jgi:hypothetical protein
MSEAGRLAGVFFTPFAALSDVARRPRWWIPMIIVGVASILLLVAFSRHVGWERAIVKGVDQSTRTQNLTPQQRRQAIEVGERITPFIAYIAPFIAALVTVLVAGVMIFFTNSLMGAEISFPSMLGVVGYSGLPPGLVTVALTVLVMFLKSPDDFDLNNPLAFNVAAFLPDGSARWLIALCSSLDLFSFWRMGLLAIGITAAAPRIRIGRALLAVVFPWALYVAVKTAVAGVFG